MADVITTLHPEGAPEDNLFPNIKKENLPSDLQPIADFAISEYEKTLNIWDEQWELGRYDWANGTGAKVASSTQIRSKNYIPAKPNVTYHFTGAEAYVLFYNVNKEYVGYAYVNSTSNATTPNNCAFITFYCFSSYGTTYNNDIIIAKGNTATAYQPFNGRVMHEIDCQGVLMWQNGNPNGSFNGGQTLSYGASLPSDFLSSYKKIRFIFKQTTGSNVQGIMDLNVAVGNEIRLFIPSDDAYRFREVTINSGGLYFDSAYIVTIGGTVTTDNTAIIPLSIYGIK